MAPKRTDVDPTMEQMQQEMGKITMMLVEQRQEGERVKSLELAMVVMQQKLETFSFLEQMQQRFLEEEEEKRRLMAMARGKMLQLEESPAEKEKGGEAITSNEEKSTTGVASTTKEPEANRVVDGMDVLAVKQACKFAKEHALKNGPIILEMDTYRYHGHSMSDPGSTYRTRDEVSGVRQVRDPIERVRKLLLSHDIATEKELKDIEKEVRKEVDDAVAQAKESPVPEPSELFTNMYVKDCGVESFGADRKELKVTLA
ncbi:hypothetical protein F2Q68_00014089 [Brassica cretica]|uniref:Dehydrogenase E1 component domain-containing protein n=1 Tax=Brassica cretica TaxID=69181 RepID=A0A8S9HK55_BRACR|nr:hypothetical protein F2Q68_00014089 [Brassica cretica]